MVTMTLAVSKELKERMDIFKEMNWSEIARQSFERKLLFLEALKNAEPESAEEIAFAVKLGKKVNKGIYKKYKELYSKELK